MAFHFVTSGVHEALERARRAADGMDMRLGGVPSTNRRHFRAGLIDELHVAIAPVLLGGGEGMIEGIDLRAWRYECVQFGPPEKAAPVVLRRFGRHDAWSRLAADGAAALPLDRHFRSL